MDVTYADIVARRVPLAPDEAVALVLAVSRARNACGNGAGAVPPLDSVLLNSDGTVTLSLTDAAGEDCVGQLAGLLHTLLLPDTPSHRPVPGALLLVVARALGEIALPRPTVAEFERLLSRFGAADPALLSSIHRRCVAAWSAARIEVQQPDALRVNLPPPVVVLQASRASMHAAMAAAAAVLMVIVAALSLYRWSTELPTPLSPGAGVISDRDVRPHSGDRGDPGAGVGPPSNSSTRDTRSRLPSSRTKARPSFAPSAAVAMPMPLVTAASVGVDVFSPSFGDSALLFHAGRLRSALMRASFDRAGDPRVSTVIQDGAANFHPTLSPDARWLAYDSDRDGIRGVYVAHADGRDPQRVSGDAYAAVPRWSPDGRTLAFIRAESRHSRVWNVWILDLTTRTMTRVSRHTVGQAWGPSWFPDANRLAYSVEDRLVIADLHSGATRVTQSPVRGRLVRTPAVSPDGQSIVFQVSHDGVWLLDVTSGAMHRVLADRAAEEFAWAPDGTRVAYHTRQHGAWSVWQLPIDRAGV
jgi:hypothetical protein